jgi:cytochrome P450
LPFQSVSGLKTFVLCMLTNPEVQKKAQAEIDKFVGRDRLPTLADRTNLVYLDACMKESSRWEPISPESLAHLARDDDEYNGWLIPAGTTMIPNIWYANPLSPSWSFADSADCRAMAHDPAEYADPFTFRPERFLGPNPEADPDFTFGFGRRICPGQVLGQTSIFIFASHLLSLFDIVPATGPDGKPLPVEVVYESGHGPVAYVFVVRFPMRVQENTNADPRLARDFPFECKPRSDKSKALFSAALDSFR